MICLLGVSLDDDNKMSHTITLQLIPINGCLLIFLH